MSKYTPLKNYLAGLPATTRDATLTFTQIERIINDKLPPSAHRHQAWWANEISGTHTNAHAWLDAGWRVESFNQSQKWVRYRRA